MGVLAGENAQPGEGGGGDLKFLKRSGREV